MSEWFQRFGQRVAPQERTPVSSTSLKCSQLGIFYGPEKTAWEDINLMTICRLNVNALYPIIFNWQENKFYYKYEAEYKVFTQCVHYIIEWNCY